MKDAPDTEKLVSLMSCRNLQKKISQLTIDSRLNKVKEMWLAEWNDMLVIYEKLNMDCKALKAAGINDDIKTLVSTIVKDQMGLDECIKQMNKIIRKYKRVLSLSFENLRSDDFLEDMEKDVKKIVFLVGNMISECSIA